MTFFPDIDVEKTKNNAKRKLREYSRWRRIAADIGEQKLTASYSFEPKQALSKPSQPVEHLALNKVSAEQELEAIRWAVSGLFDSLHRRILVEKYLLPEPKQDLAIYSDLAISETLYYEENEKALLAFAELFRHGILLVEKVEN
ncbi:ArpU family phage packaging/lysis transcriptional regulator [Streptococcus sp. sy010]|uniref:ArpU family phage packaging/lysis transcriptional regulator n=1 Tax=Streptococcus sp. sy010 TaxID=2600148 RepID=UPI0011B5F8A0|nr:ArpU family phage packaging/lysis transcriptional regulator [Streptococcus sp. sy010]TWT16443.1 ArpU family transcriptional regulator [Streptococcus sp. sy010]